MSTLAPDSDSKFLQRAALASLRHLRFAPRQRVHGGNAGRHRSHQHGGSSEFADYRQYTPGEDLRRLDWKVLARTGRPYVRLYQDETDMRCLLLLDASASMDFGSPNGLTKLQYAKYLATAMSQLILDQLDCVGAAIAGAGVVDRLLPGGTPTHVRRVQSLIEAAQPLAQTDLVKALDDIRSTNLRSGSLILLSDFLVDDLDALFASLRLFRRRRWDVLLLHIVDRSEETLPDGVAWRFEGLENEGAVDCSPAEVKCDYEARFSAFCAEVRTLALASDCDYRRLSTATHYLQSLSGFLVPRGG